MRNRQEAAQQALEIIDAQVLQFMQWLNSLDTVSTIRALREQANTIQQQALQTARQRLQQGIDPEQIIQEMSRSLTNKLIHAPSSQLRNADSLRRQDLLKAAWELFNLSHNIKPASKDK